MSETVKNFTINSHNFQVAEFGRTVYLIKLDPSVTIEDLKRSEAYVHIAKKLKPGARIEFQAEDHSFIAFGYVTEASGNNVEVEVYSFIDFKEEETVAEKEVTELYEVEYKKGDNWRVIRKSDNKLIESGFSSKKKALDSLVKISEG